MDFKAKPKAPATVSGDTADTLATKGYVDDVAGSGGGTVAPPVNLKPYAKKSDVVKLLNGYQKYEYDPSKWQVLTEIDLSSLGMGVQSVAAILGMMEIYGYDSFLSYTGDSDYIIIPEGVLTETMIPTFMSEPELVSLFAFMQTNGDMGTIPDPPLGVGGDVLIMSRPQSLLLFLHDMRSTHIELLYLDTRKCEFFNYSFSPATIAELDLSTWDTSSVNDMDSMFRECENLTSLDLSSWDTSSVNDMNSMFRECGNLTSLDLSSWDTSSVNDMNNMFLGCGNLTSLDLSSWDTSSVNYMENMFFRCGNLTSLDLSSWDTSSVNDMDNMFRYCTSLTHLYTRTRDDADKFIASYAFPSQTNVYIGPPDSAVLYRAGT